MFELELFCRTTFCRKTVHEMLLGALTSIGGPPIDQPTEIGLEKFVPSVE